MTGRGDQGCIGREGASEGVPEAVGQAVGGGRQSGWGRLPSVTNAIEAGTWGPGDSGWALARRPGRGGGGLPPFQCIPGGDSAAPPTCTPREGCNPMGQHPGDPTAFGTVRPRGGGHLRVARRREPQPSAPTNRGTPAEAVRGRATKKNNLRHPRVHGTHGVRRTEAGMYRKR